MAEMMTRLFSSSCLFLCGCFFLLISCTNAVGSDAAIDLSLKKALTMALSNNLDLHVYALDSSLAKTEIQQSQSIYDPYLSASANYGQTFYTGETYGVKDTTTSIGLTQYLPSGGSLTASSYTGYSKPVSDDPSVNWTDWYTSVGITLSQPLLKNFGRENMELNITLAENSHKESLEEFRESVTETVYQVIKAYNRLYTLRQVLESKKSGLSSAQRLLEQIQRQIGSGRQQEVALANTEYVISQRLRDLVAAEKQIKDQEAELRYLLGEQQKLTLVPVDPPSRVEPEETTEQAIQLALENRSDLKQLQISLESGQLQERVAKRRLLPNLAVTGGIGFRGIEDQFSDSLEQIGEGRGRWWSAGLQLSVPLGNNMAKSEYQRKKLRAKQIKSRITALEWQLRDKIEMDMRSLVSARVQMQVADKAFNAAQKQFEKYRLGVAEKTSKVKDLLDAERDLINAGNNQTEALEVFANAVARLWKDAGVLLERLNINIDTGQPEKVTAGTEHLDYPLSSPVDFLAKKKSIENSTPQKPLPVASKDDPVAPTATKSNLPETDNAIYTLKIGEYASSELAKTEQKIKSAGLNPQIATGAKQQRLVTRLTYGDFSELQLAKKQLSKLRKTGAGGFLLNLGEKGYRLYAGSFFSRGGALKEQQRLATLGISVSLQEVNVQLPTSLVTVGRFMNRDAALVVAAKLQQLGLNAVIEKCI
ncbi:TolC family protein [Malonomonas rubra]|uniref:TolC family protein n=1 Tax=Malonomonas rubra TaxID=57040 RepID=UPI0026EB9AC4|nr:TolC family protein [Malonomonas rubra]